MKTKTISAVWHGHHDILISFVNFKDRINTIKKDKPKHEQQIRLRLMKKIDMKLLPKEVVKAGMEMGDGYLKLLICFLIPIIPPICRIIIPFTNYDKIIKKFSKELNELHKKECKNCTWNGRKLVFE